MTRHNVQFSFIILLVPQIKPQASPPVTSYPQAKLTPQPLSTHEQRYSEVHFLQELDLQLGKSESAL